MKEELTERLYKAYDTFERCEWDEIAGKKPDGFDDLPRYPKAAFLRKKGQEGSRYELVKPIMKHIEEIVGVAELSRYYWTTNMGFTDDEWLEMYLTCQD